MRSRQHGAYPEETLETGELAMRLDWFVVNVIVRLDWSHPPLKWSLAQLKSNHQVQLKNHPPLKMSHIPKNKKKVLIPRSKTMMTIKKHPQLMIKLKWSLMIKY